MSDTLSPVDDLFLDTLRAPKNWDELRVALPFTFPRLRSLIEQHLDAGRIAVQADGRFVVRSTGEIIRESLNGGAR